MKKILVEGLKKLMNVVKKVAPVAVLASSVAVANAQVHNVRSFLNVRSLQLSNNTSVVFSNIASFPGMSNVFGIVYTNNAGSQVRITNAADYTKLANDVNLWGDRDGSPISYYFPSNTITALSTNAAVFSSATLFISMICGSAANSAVTFVFQPMWDGVQAPSGTADDWSVAVTASTSSTVTLATNAPMWRWPGAKALRLKSIINADTDGAGEVKVTKAAIVGFVP